MRICHLKKEASFLGNKPYPIIVAESHHIWGAIEGYWHTSDATHWAAIATKCGIAGRIAAIYPLSEIKRCEWEPSHFSEHQIIEYV